jgi:sulfur carrier protein ThiS
MKIVIEKSVVPLPGLALRAPVEIPDGSSIRDLLRRGTTGGEELYLLPSVNGVARKLDHVLVDGDRLALYRISAGG